MPLLWVLVGILWFAVFCFALLCWSLRARYLHGVPSAAKWYPVLGHTLSILEKRDVIHTYMLETALKLKKTFFFGLFNSEPSLVLVGSPADCEYVLKGNFENYRLPERRIDLLRELFGQGIFGSNGKQWKFHRKAASHIFTQRNLRQHMTNVFVKHGREMISILEDAAKNGSRVDLQKLFFRYTMDSFSEVAFGVSTESLRKESVPFSDAFDRGQREMTKRFFNPFWKLFRLVGLGPEGIIAKDVKVMNGFAYEMIQRRRKDEESGKVTNDDLISHYLRSAKALGDTMTDEDLRDVVINFMVAGRDTTAAALTWFFWEIMQRPDIEKQLIQELYQVLGDPTAEHDYYTKAYQLNYMHTVLLEVLRLHPSVPSDDREALKNDTLPSGIKIPAGTLINFHPYINNRSPQTWGSDAEEFNPMRWDEDGKRKLRTDFEYSTFSAGPRLCLGRTLALLEAKTLLAMILPRFHFAHADKRDDYVVSLILYLKHGLPVTVKTRESLSPESLSLSRTPSISYSAEDDAVDSADRGESFSVVRKRG